VIVFLDANFIIRALLDPPTAADRAMAEQANELLRLAADARRTVTTSEAVIAEVAHILSSPDVYRMPPGDMATTLKPVLALPGMLLASKYLYVRALDIWSSRPRLGFVDALTVAYAERGDVELATFDRDFEGLPGITRYQPPRI
jgi:predicted nucleic acid-binding protein